MKSTLWVAALLMGAWLALAEPAEAQYIGYGYPYAGYRVGPTYYGGPVYAPYYRQAYPTYGPYYFGNAGPYFGGPGANYYYYSYWYAPYNITPYPYYPYYGRGYYYGIY